MDKRENFFKRIPMTSTTFTEIEPINNNDEKPALSPLNRIPLLDFTIDALRKAIINGEISPGERLDEVSIATRLNISRPTIREAMRQLEHEGLLTRIPFRGTFARQFTRHEIEELNSLRGVLEAYAAEIIIQSGKHSPGHLAPLFEIVQQMEKISSEEGGDRTVDLHISFHRTLVMIANNKLLSNIWTILAQQFLVALRISQLSYVASGEGSKIAKAHQVIIDALLSGDVEQARDVIRMHVSDSGLTSFQFPDDQ